MINETQVKKYCSEDISKIENYEQAVADQTQTWDCHHRWETDRGLSIEELIFCCEYYYVPADRLIFLMKAEHTRQHKLGNKNSLGKHHSDTAKEKISETLSGRKLSAATKEKCMLNQPARRTVQMFDKKTGELLATFSSTREAERKTGIAQCSISGCCNSKCKSAGGYKWSYL